MATIVTILVVHTVDESLPKREHLYQISAFFTKQLGELLPDFLLFGNDKISLFHQTNLVKAIIYQIFWLITRASGKY